MYGTNQSQFQPGQAVGMPEFQAKLDTLRELHRPFAAYVRMTYLMIDRAIREGVPQEAILSALNEQFGQNGTIKAFKSALQRIRREREAKQTLGWNPDSDFPPFAGGAASSQGGGTFDASWPNSQVAAGGTVNMSNSSAGGATPHWNSHAGRQMPSAQQPWPNHAGAAGHAWPVPPPGSTQTQYGPPPQESAPFPPGGYRPML